MLVTPGSERVNKNILFVFFFLSVYRLFVSTGFSGIKDDKVSIILVGQGGAQTSIHDLRGPFDRKRQVFSTPGNERIGHPEEYHNIPKLSLTRSLFNSTLLECHNGIQSTCWNVGT